jgi:hypothetical protein
MAEIGAEQESSAAAPAVTPGAHQGPVDGGGDLEEAILAMSAKFDAGALTAGSRPPLLEPARAGN